MQMKARISEREYQRRLEVSLKSTFNTKLKKLNPVQYIAITILPKGMLGIRKIIGI